MVKEINAETFQYEVLKSDKPVVVDFWAPWCGPCKMIAPVFEKLSHELKQAKFCKINVDENQDIASQNAVMGIPCLLIFKNGEETTRIVGYNDEETLKKKILSAI